MHDVNRELRRRGAKTRISAFAVMASTAITLAACGGRGKYATSLSTLVALVLLPWVR
jgi:hypothetical protein